MGSVGCGACRRYQSGENFLIITLHSLMTPEQQSGIGGGGWDSRATWGFGCRVCGGGHGTLEPTGDLAVGYRRGGSWDSRATWGFGCRV